MAHARKHNGRGPQHQIYETVKKGLDALLKAFRDDESSIGELTLYSLEVNQISLL